MERAFRLLIFLASFLLISWSQYCHCSRHETSWQSTLSSPSDPCFCVLFGPVFTHPPANCKDPLKVSPLRWGPGTMQPLYGSSFHIWIPSLCLSPSPEGAHNRHDDDPKQNCSFHEDTSPFQFAYFCSSSCRHSAPVCSHSFSQQVCECPPCAKHWTRYRRYKMSKTKTGSLKDVSELDGKKCKIAVGVNATKETLPTYSTIPFSEALRPPCFIKPTCLWRWSLPFWPSSSFSKLFVPHTRVY